MKTIITTSETYSGQWFKGDMIVKFTNRCHPPIQNQTMRLFKYRETPIRWHIKVKGNRSPYDGDWIYWSTRMGKHPQMPTRVAKLFKQQQGKCSDCELYFQAQDELEIDHIIPLSQGGKDIYSNLQLLHRHCHVNKSRIERNHNAG